MQQNSPVPQLSRRLILSNLSSFLAGGVASRVLSAIALFVIARQIGPESYAQYAPTLATVGLTAVFFTLSTENWLVYKGGQAATELPRLSGFVLVLRLLLGLVWLAVLMPSSRVLNAETFPYELIFWAGLSIYFEKQCDLCYGIFKANLRNDIAAGLLTFFNFSFFAMVIWLWSQGQQDAQLYLQVRAIAAALTAVGAIGYSLRFASWQMDLALPRIVLRGTGVFAISTVLAEIYARADVTIVAQFLGQDGSVLYSPASSLINAMYIFPAAGYVVAIPVLGRILQADEKRFKRLVYQIVLGAVAAGLVSGILIAISAQPLIQLTFGEAYRATGGLLSVLGWVFALKCVSFALAACVVAVGWQSRRITVQIVAALVNVGANLLIIDQYGVYGVAWVYVASELIIVIGYGIWLRLWLRTSH